MEPERVRHLVSFAPYSLTWDDYQQGPPNYAQIRALWYQQVLQSELSEQLLAYDQRGFCRYLWETWSPTWPFEETTFTAASEMRASVEESTSRTSRTTASSRAPSSELTSMAFAMLRSRTDETSA
jgi:hypothetical protein